MIFHEQIFAVERYSAVFLLHAYKIFHRLAGKTVIVPHIAFEREGRIQLPPVVAVAAGREIRIRKPANRFFYFALGKSIERKTNALMFFSVDIYLHDFLLTDKIISTQEKFVYPFC